LKRKPGNPAIIAQVILNLVAWFVFLPVSDGRQNFERAWAGEILGSTVIILMASALFLSTRPKWAEPYFGGPDKMYQTLRRAATSAFSLPFLHVLTVPIRTTNLRAGNYLAMVAFPGTNTLGPEENATNFRI
jgi:predicted ferric reductase